MSQAAAIPSLDASDAFQDAVLRECLASFPHVRLTVTGDCMCPGLASGETVLLTAAAQRRPWLGDVVLVRQAEGLRLHRLVWGPPLTRGGAWRTQADRGPIWDPRVRAEDVLATVVAVERAGRLERVGGFAAGLRLLGRGLRAWARGRWRGGRG
jgi:hypothetical protein